MLEVPAKAGAGEFHDLSLQVIQKGGKRRVFGKNRSDT